MSDYVGPRGKVPNRVMIIGERPGVDEVASGRPFVGRSGQEQEAYLKRHGLSSYSMYVTNLVKTYEDGANPDQSDVDIWTETLEEEIAEVRPSVILAVGRWSARWFLGDVDMETVHGIPYHSPRAPDKCIVVPCYHPANAFYDETGQVRSLIAWDYAQAAAAIQGKLKVQPRIDEWEGVEAYRDVGGVELAAVIDEAIRCAPHRPGEGGVAAIDTEGVSSDVWSIQVSFTPGEGWVLRQSRPDFAIGITALQRLADAGCLIILHNGMYDIEMCRVMGLNLSLPHVHLWDTMYAAYILCLEPQGLKQLAYRWCGMKMRSYPETVGEAGIAKQLPYLEQVVAKNYAKPEPYIIYRNDGTTQLYSPQSVSATAKRILTDYRSGKLNKGGERTDPWKRWNDIDRAVREIAEREYGPMPVGTLADLPLGDAVYYAARDPDATLRLFYRMRDTLKAQGLTNLHANGMAVLPVFEEMQSNGIPADRRHFEMLRDRMTRKMDELRDYVSRKYYRNRPFNPNSVDQVRAIMLKRGLVGEKWTKGTGKVSTGKKSIEHLRHTDDAIEHIIDWREHAKIRDGFAIPIIESFPPGARFGNVRTIIKITRVATRRISTSGIPLAAIPVRHELGLEVRRGFIAPPGQSFGSWDLSQIEMRYMAHLSEDPLLIQFFLEGRDVHAETASRIFGIDIRDVKEMEHRYPAKRAGFGIITNITGAGLYDQLRMFGCAGWSVERCDELIEEWLVVYEGVKKFLDVCKTEAQRDGMVSDEWGMPRYLPGVWANDKKTRAEAERAASSHKIQGGAQGMLQQSMAWLRPRIWELCEAGANIRWLMQIHDELMLQFDTDLWETVDAVMMEGLTKHSKELLVPVKAKGTMAKTWGELKG